MPDRDARKPTIVTSEIVTPDLKITKPLLLKHSPLFIPSPEDIICYVKSVNSLYLNNKCGQHKSDITRFQIYK